MDVLYKTQADLLKGKEKLEQMMQTLEKEKVGEHVFWSRKVRKCTF